MSYKKFIDDIKAMDMKNVCILWGKERFLTEWAEGQIIGAYSNEVSRQFDVSEFDGEETDIYKIIEACETLPLFSEKKVVVVDRLPALEGKKGNGNEESLVEYMKNPSNSTILVFVCGEKIDKRRTLYKAASKSGTVYEFDKLKTPELKSWIKKRFKQHKKIVGSKELDLLINLSGYFDKDSDYSLYNFENDLSKAILHSTGDTITEEDIQNSVTGNYNKNVFELIDYIGAGDKRSAFNILSDLFLYGQNEYGMLALISRQYENLYNVKVLQKEGLSRGQIAEILSAKDFVVSKWLSLAGKYSEEKLKSIMKSIYNTDKMVKTGDMEIRTAIEILIGTI